MSLSLRLLISAGIAGSAVMLLFPGKSEKVPARDEASARSLKRVRVAGAGGIAGEERRAGRMAVERLRRCTILVRSVEMLVEFRMIDASAGGELSGLIDAGKYEEALASVAKRHGREEEWIRRVIWFQRGLRDRDGGWAAAEGIRSGREQQMHGSDCLSPDEYGEAMTELCRAACYSNAPDRLSWIRSCLLGERGDDAIRYMTQAAAGHLLITGEVTMAQLIEGCERFGKVSGEVYGDGLYDALILIRRGFESGELSSERVSALLAELRSGVEIFGTAGSLNELSEESARLKKAAGF